MANLFHITHEVDLSEYDATVTDSGDLSADAAAALVGSKGLQLVIDDSNAIYGSMTNETKGPELRERFYIDPNELTMANNDAFNVLYTKQQGGSYGAIVNAQLKYTTAAGYQLVCEIFKDTPGPAFTDTENITDAVHYVEIHVVRATNSGSGDGTCEWWIDGVSKGSASSIDNYNRVDDYNWLFEFGARGGLDAGTSGTFFLDDFRANNDGSAIGPAVTGPTGVKTIGDLAVASIKTINDVAIASVATINDAS